VRRNKGIGRAGICPQNPGCSVALHLAKAFERMKYPGMMRRTPDAAYHGFGMEMKRRRRSTGMMSPRYGP
jgi:hypothetical protein